MIELNELIEISKYAGERFDLVQAGGGNSSVKLDNDEMIIKASGFSLSDVSESSGFSKVKTSAVASIVTNSEILNLKDKRIREKFAVDAIKSATIDKHNRPSIETLLHSFLDKYTLHTHPLVVNMIVIRKDWKEILKHIFKDEKIVLVEYKTPGIELAIELHKEINIFSTKPKIIFLQNHGLIIHSDNKRDIQNLTELVLQKIESFLQVDFSRYKQTNKISAIFNQYEKLPHISYLSEDLFLNKALKENRDLFFQTPFCPDSLVYCGISSCKIEEIQAYRQKYFELPKVIVDGDKLFFRAKNIKKAKEMEEVMKFHIMVLSQCTKNDTNFLEIEELAYLDNWEAEKYRQGV